MNRPPKEKKHFAVSAKSETKRCTVVLTEYRFEAVDGKIHAYRRRNVKLLGVTKTYQSTEEVCKIVLFKNNTFFSKNRQARMFSL